MKTKSKVDEIMKSYGFHLHRRSNHLIWRDDNGNQIVTGKSISDHRAILNILKTVRRVRANRQTAH